MKKEIILSLLFNIISILISLGFVSYLTKTLSVENFGNYQLVISFIGIVGIFSLSGLNMVLNRNILNGKDYIFNCLFYKNYKIVIKIFILLLLIVFLLKVLITNEKLDLFLIALLFLPILGLDRYESVLYAKQKFIKIRILSLVNVSLNVFLSILLFEYTHNYLWIFFSMYLVKSIVIYIGLKYVKILLENSNDNNCTDELKESHKLSLLSFYNIGIGQLDKLILGFMDISSLAVYAVGILIPLRVRDQIKLVASILVQKWAKGGKDYYAFQVKKYSVYIFTFNFLLATIISITAKFYIPLFFGTDYLDSISIIWIMAYSMPFMINSYIYEAYIITFHNTTFFRKVTYSKQVIYIVLLSIFVYYEYGIIGISLAFLIRSLYTYIISYIYYIKYRKIDE